MAVAGGIQEEMIVWWIYMFNLLCHPTLPIINRIRMFRYAIAFRWQLSTNFCLAVSDFMSLF
jgi:hypothetical protein